MVWSRLGLVVVATALAPHLATAAGPLNLRAEAGIGGIARAGRWMPVRVSLEATDRDLDGEVVVSWGDAVVRRSVALPAPSRNQFDVYIRTSDVRATATVQVRTAEQVQSIDVPVRVVQAEDEVTLCIVSAGENIPDAEMCTASVTTEAVPRSMRAFDAVDRIVWERPSMSLDAAQRAAVERWQVYRELDDTDVLTRSPRPLPPPAQPGASARSLVFIAIAGTVYVLALTGALSLARFPRFRSYAPYAATLSVVALACAGALLVGRGGPASAVHVQHTSVLYQLSRGGSALTMRAVADFPAYDAYRLQTDLIDASLTRDDGRAQPSQFDADGRPMLSGTYALGSSQSFKIEGVTERAPLAVVRQADTIRVTNTSKEALLACRFPDGYSVEAVGELLPGATAQAREVRHAEIPVFSCLLSQTPVAFSDGRYRVDVSGSTFVNVHLPSSRPEETPR